jgi:hypothetical protein
MSSLSRLYLIEVEKEELEILCSISQLCFSLDDDDLPAPCLALPIIPPDTFTAVVADLASLNFGCEARKSVTWSDTPPAWDSSLQI